MATDGTFTALRRLSELGREAERRRAPDPYPRPTGTAPSLEELRVSRTEIDRIAAIHGAETVRVFGSVARGDAGPNSDLDILVEMGDRRTLLDQAGLQGDLEDLLGCPVHIVTTGGLRYADEDTRVRINREAISL
jgi:uncharacterized protein